MERSREAVWIRRALTALALVLVAYLVWSIWDYEALMGWMARARPIPFFIAMAVLPALAFPFTPLYMLAGATFDTRIALAGTALALAANLLFCYAVGRSRLRPRVMSLFARFGYELPDFDVRDSASVRKSVRFATVVKAAPGIPGFVKHYGLGAARVPFWVYFVVGMVFSGGYAVALIIVGDSLFEHELSRGTIALIVMAAALLAVRAWIRRRRRNRTEDAFASSPSGR